MTKRLKPIMLCPYCEYITHWDTSRENMNNWNKHIKECEAEEKRHLDDNWTIGGINDKTHKD